MRDNSASRNCKMIAFGNHDDAMPRKPKHATAQIETWKCGDCEFVWYYQTLKCPICTSFSLTRIN